MQLWATGLLFIWLLVPAVCSNPCGSEFSLISKEFQCGLPTFCVIATGGTIQAGAESPKERFHYENTPAYGKKLFNRWENVTAYNIFVYEPWNIGSHNMKIHHMVHLARIIYDAAMNGADGVLVTYGTDTMAEFGSALQWLRCLVTLWRFICLIFQWLKSFQWLSIRKNFQSLVRLIGRQSGIPVVITGASNPSSSECSDGPENLDDALAVISSHDAWDRDVMIVINRRIIVAKYAMKNDAGRIGGLDGPEYGSVLDGRVSFLYAPSVSNAHSIPLEKLENLQSLTPQVTLMMAHQDRDIQALNDTVSNIGGTLVAVGFGDGYQPDEEMSILEYAATKGIKVVVAARSGKIARTTWSPGLIPCFDLDYSKCLLLAKFADLAGYNDKETRALFDGRGEEVIREMQGATYLLGMDTWGVFVISRWKSFVEGCRRVVGNGQSRIIPRIW